MDPERPSNKLTASIPNPLPLSHEHSSKQQPEPAADPTMRLQLAALCLVALAGAASAFLPPSSRLSRPAVAASSSRAVSKARLGPGIHPHSTYPPAPLDHTHACPQAAVPRLVMSAAAAGEELLSMAKKDYVSSLPDQVGDWEG